MGLPNEEKPQTWKTLTWKTLSPSNSDLPASGFNKESALYQKSSLYYSSKIPRENLTLNDVRKDAEKLKVSIEEVVAHLSDKKMSPDARNLLFGFRDHIGNFITESRNGEFNSKAADSLRYATRFAASFANIALQMPGMSPLASSTAATAVSIANRLQELSQTPEFSDHYLPPPPTPTPILPPRTTATANEPSNEIDLRETLTKLERAINEAREQFDKLQAKGNSLSDEIAGQIQAAKDLFDDGAKKVKTSQDAFTHLIGIATGEVLNIDYAKNAKREEEAADLTRYGALFFMALAITTLVYALFFEQHHEIDWQIISIRLFLAVALSIPAGYLARESIRHRGQQHSYLRTALNLQAITPFIASLPEEQQHALKSTMAERLFGNQPLPDDHHDTGIPNIQELAVKLTRELRKFKKIAD